MDMPPPVEVQYVKVIDYDKYSDKISLVPEGDVDEFYKRCYLNRIDGPDITDNVKKFAKDNDCIDVMKSYYWSSKIFKNKGNVYGCHINGKKQYIYEQNNKIRFARWYEKHKFKKHVFDYD